MESKLKMILAIVNNKGGVGKTTTVQNLAAGMLRKNKKLRILENSEIYVFFGLFLWILDNDYLDKAI